MFEFDYIALTRTFFEDTIYVRIKDIRAITGAVGSDSPDIPPAVIPNAATIYLEGELGFSVNYSVAELIALINAKQVKN